MRLWRINIVYMLIAFYHESIMFSKRSSRPVTGHECQTRRHTQYLEHRQRVSHIREGMSRKLTLYLCRSEPTEQSNTGSVTEISPFKLGSRRCHALDGSRSPTNPQACKQDQDQSNLGTDYYPVLGTGRQNFLQVQLAGFLSILAVVLCSCKLIYQDSTWIQVFSIFEC